MKGIILFIVTSLQQITSVASCFLRMHQSSHPYNAIMLLSCVITCPCMIILVHCVTKPSSGLTSQEVFEAFIVHEGYHCHYDTNRHRLSKFFINRYILVSQYNGDIWESYENLLVPQKVIFRLLIRRSICLEYSLINPYLSCLCVLSNSFLTFDILS